MAKIRESEGSGEKNGQWFSNGIVARVINWIKENFSTIILPLIAIVLLAFGIYFYSTSPVKPPQTLIPAQTTTEKKEQPKETQTQPKSDETAKTKESAIGTGGPETTDANVYTEKAAKGDGITHLARKALKRYLSSEGQSLSLSKEHKIYIEDYLKDKTGSYKLKVGQEISFSVNLIKDAISQAQKLAQSQLNNLKKYSQLVPSL